MCVHRYIHSSLKSRQRRSKDGQDQVISSGTGKGGMWWEGTLDGLFSTAHAIYAHKDRKEQGRKGREGDGRGREGRERERERERWERAIYMSTVITYSIDVGEEWKGESYTLHVFTKQHAISFSLRCVSDWLLYLLE